MEVILKIARRDPSTLLGMTITRSTILLHGLPPYLRLRFDPAILPSLPLARFALSRAASVARDPEHHDGRARGRALSRDPNRHPERQPRLRGERRSRRRQSAAQGERAG